MREEGWITKAEAAAKLGVDERTIERRARAGRLNTRARPGFPTLYLAAQVEMLAQTTNQEVRTGLVETVPTLSSNGNGAVASLRGHTPSFEEVLVGLVQAAQRALTQGATGPTGPTGPTPGPTGPTLTPAEIAAQYVTLAEAAVIKRLTPTYLLRKIHDGTLKAEKDRGWKIRRKDLEQL